MMKKTILLMLMCAFSAINFSAKADGVNDQPVSTSVVNGKVTDRMSGESLAGAVVLVKETGLRIYTDFDGNFVINNLAPGTYSLQVELISYQPEGVNSVSVTAGSASFLSIEVDPQ